jgi:hypothetical protein
MRAPMLLNYLGEMAPSLLNRTKIAKSSDDNLIENSGRSKKTTAEKAVASTAPSGFLSR